MIRVGDPRESLKSVRHTNPQSLVNVRRVSIARHLSGSQIGRTSTKQASLKAHRPGRRTSSSSTTNGGIDPAAAVPTCGSPMLIEIQHVARMLLLSRRARLPGWCDFGASYGIVSRWRNDSRAIRKDRCCSTGWINWHRPEDMGQLVAFLLCVEAGAGWKAILHALVPGRCARSLPRVIVTSWRDACRSRNLCTTSNRTA